MISLVATASVFFSMAIRRYGSLHHRFTEPPDRFDPASVKSRVAGSVVNITPDFSEFTIRCTMTATSIERKIHFTR